LEVGETWLFTARHTVTQAEIDTGGTLKIGRASGRESDNNEAPPDTEEANVPVVRNPALNIVKDVSSITNPNGSAGGATVDQAGDRINYRITVQNTGNTTLTGVTVTDPFADAGSIVRGADVVGDNDALLEVGETWLFTARHTVTQAEIDAGGTL